MKWINVENIRLSDRRAIIILTGRDEFVHYDMKLTSLVNKMNNGLTTQNTVGSFELLLKQIILDNFPQFEHCLVWGANFNMMTQCWAIAISHDSLEPIPDGEECPAFVIKKV